MSGPVYPYRDRRGDHSIGAYNFADGLLYRNEKTGELETLRERIHRVFSENHEEWAEVFAQR